MGALMESALFGGSALESSGRLAAAHNARASGCTGRSGSSASCQGRDGGGFEVAFPFSAQSRRKLVCLIESSRLFCKSGRAVVCSSRSCGGGGSSASPALRRSVRGTNAFGRRGLGGLSSSPLGGGRSCGSRRGSRGGVGVRTCSALVKAERTLALSIDYYQQRLARQKHTGGSISKKIKSLLLGLLLLLTVGTGFCKPTFAKENMTEVLLILQLEKDVRTIQSDITIIKGDMTMIRKDIDILKKDIEIVKKDIWAKLATIAAVLAISSKSFLFGIIQFLFTFGLARFKGSKDGESGQVEIDREKRR